jgi:hypothetical protein
MMSSSLRRRISMVDTLFPLLTIAHGWRRGSHQATGPGRSMRVSVGVDRVLQALFAGMGPRL